MITDQDVRRIEDKVDNVSLSLAELRGSLSPSLQQLTERQHAIVLEVADHEARLRVVERFRFSVPSIAFLSLLASAVAIAAHFIW